SAYASLGDVDLQTGKPDLALEHYNNGHVIITALAKMNPDSVEILSSLSTSFYRLATARLYMKHLAEADENYLQSLKIKERLASTDPANTSHKAGIMLAKARLGRHEEAAKVAAELAKKGANDPSMLFRAACGYALCVAGAVHGKAADQVTP